MQLYRRNFLKGMLPSAFSRPRANSHTFVEMDSYPGGGPWSRC